MATTTDTLDFVHISDCHFGPDLANQSQPWRIVSAVGVTQPTHDVVLCKELCIALEDVRTFAAISDNVRIPVVVSGDSTATGAAGEFAAANSFLRGLWHLRRHAVSLFDQSIGLDLSTETLAAVPGNHDHWKGQTWFSSPVFNPRLYPDHFRPTPWRKTWRSTAGQILLDLYGLDSNSGLKGVRNHRARGAFDNTQLALLDQWLSDHSKVKYKDVAKRIVAIVIHHSLAFTANPVQTAVTWISETEAPLELDEQSRARLLEIAAKHNCVAILTGHTHDSYHQEFPVEVSSRTQIIHELRCTTTLQGPPETAHQGFLLHRIHLTDGAWRWSTWEYSFDHEGRFARTPNPRWFFAVP